MLATGMETSRVAQLPWESLGSLPSDIAQRNHPVLQSPQQRLIGLEPVLVSRLYSEAKMKVGDLVKIKGVHHRARRRLGIVVRDMTIIYSLAILGIHRVGELQVLWNDGTTANATYANLEVISESR